MRARHVALLGIASAGVAAALVALRPPVPDPPPPPPPSAQPDEPPPPEPEEPEPPPTPLADPSAAPPWSVIDPGSDAACSPGMVLVDAVRCPFAAHRCADGGRGGKPCHRWVAEVLCEGDPARLRFCVDRFEYPNLPGVRPASAIAFDEAERACAAEDKRLCTVAEWSLACEGPGLWPLPTGVRRDPAACAIDRPRFTREALDPAGTRLSCASPFGVVDLLGSVDEWTVDPHGTAERPPHRWVLAGGPSTGGRSCREQVTDADRGASEATGFRCCADATAPGPGEEPRAPGQAAPTKAPLPGWTALAIPAEPAIAPAP